MRKLFKSCIKGLKKAIKGGDFAIYLCVELREHPHVKEFVNFLTYFGVNHIDEFYIDSYNSGAFGYYGINHWDPFQRYNKAKLRHLKRAFKYYKENAKDWGYE